ncbi:hypothetical protein BABINDRAFT_21129, partial [Babjeviella inositovora NRRL Y-12698]
LQMLLESLSSIIDQISKSVLDLSKASIKAHELFKHFRVPTGIAQSDMNVDTATNDTLGRIVKIALHFIDNLLRNEVYSHSRALVLKSFGDFYFRTQADAHTHGDLHDPAFAPPLCLAQPELYAIGSTATSLPNEHTLLLIIEKLTLSSTQLMDQEGSFIAPVLRGIVSNRLAVLTIVFGFPEPNSAHYDTLLILFTLYPDVHFTVQKNLVRECGQTSPLGFKPPFRIPTNPLEPPMSLSLAAVHATALSGTLGGYVYPKIAASAPGLQAYAGSVFAVTCGHVVLKDTAANEEGNMYSVNSYPHVAVPSPVLINMYRAALTHERGKYPAKSEESYAYAHVIAQIDALFPCGDAGKNTPATPFGQLVWGERTILHKTNKLSDLAIIKMDKTLRCHNTLGDDVSFAEYDPSLMFKNLRVRKTVTLLDFVETRGMHVFKYGSTSKFTQGRVNGIKMVYWANGKLQTSEFVIASTGGARALAGLFASGGDSGAWILTKLQDLQSATDPERARDYARGGLGVCGMLHSYDGEFKQFGLFTPMEDVLSRLHEVTNVEWGI